MTFVNEPDNRRTIDYDRNIIFKHSERQGNGRQDGPNGEVTVYFDLIEKGERYQVVADQLLKKISDGNFILTWKVFSIACENIDKRKELKIIVNEALETYGALFGKSGVSEMSITFSSAI